MYELHSLFSLSGFPIFQDEPTEKSSQGTQYVTIILNATLQNFAISTLVFDRIWPASVWRFGFLRIKSLSFYLNEQKCIFNLWFFTLINPRNLRLSIFIAAFPIFQDEPSQKLPSAQGNKLHIPFEFVSNFLLNFMEPVSICNGFTNYCTQLGSNVKFSSTWCLSKYWSEGFVLLTFGD